MWQLAGAVLLKGVRMTSKPSWYVHECMEEVEETYDVSAVPPSAVACQ